MALWGGRFDTPTDALVWQFNQSLPFDRKMWREDITGSIAHARMLGVQGIIPAADADALPLDALLAGGEPVVLRGIARE